MAEVNRVKALFFLNILLFFAFSSSIKAFEVIRDTEIEEFTNDILKLLLTDNDIEAKDVNVYFINKCLFISKSLFYVSTYSLSLLNF